MRRLPRLVYLATVALLLLLVLARDWWKREQRMQAGIAQSRSVNALANQVAEIQRVEAQADQTVWAQERLAEECGRAFEDLWDTLNASSNKLQTAALFPVAAMTVPAFGAAQSVSNGIELLQQSGTNGLWTSTEWQALLAEAQRDGWQLGQTEFRHLAFDVDARNQPSRSRYYWSAHLTNNDRPERVVLEGHFNVVWQTERAPGSRPTIQRLEPIDLSLRKRKGKPPFAEVLNKVIAPVSGSYFIDPLILYDLDGDGSSEIILAARNLVLHRRPDGTYEERPLCEQPPGLIFTGIIADFDGDGLPDFLCAKFEGLWLYPGAPSGVFTGGRQVWVANPHLKYAQTLTCGDIDGDGDLDVWVGQYKVPYDRGQMPTPFYDANDGFPSYLLLNDGHGEFKDATVSAGLGNKRWRRAYSASLVDLNHDQHLDLVIANDFAGLDVYDNDGQGHFTDVTDQWFSERRSFGMAQLCADFDRDGRLDLLVVGMNVPVLDRLLHAQLVRRGYERYLRMGAQMAAGNRLFLGQAQGGFLQGTLNSAIARTGWSWGASATDFDNDGFVDLYVANGHETKQSVRDYETEFWLHDIYVGNSHDNLPAFAYYRAKSEQTRGRGMSYGGNERNRFFLNRAGQDFVEVSHLMGTAMAEDSRNVVADDLDGDGRMDLLVTTFEAWPQPKQTLRIFANQIPGTGHWIGFRLRELGGGLSPVGARVVVHSGTTEWTKHVVAGDSYRSQESTTVHFGLGEASTVDWAEVIYLDGATAKLDHPSIDEYHRFPAPRK